MTGKGLTIKQLDATDSSQLSKELEKAKTELFSLRFAWVVDNFEDHGRIKTIRRDIVRIYTVARERGLGYRTAPSAEE